MIGETEVLMTVIRQINLYIRPVSPIPDKLDAGLSRLSRQLLQIYERGPASSADPQP
jgi:hypothetical protein